MKGVKVGYLAQEPHLDAGKTVKENILEGVKDKQAILERYEEVIMPEFEYCVIITHFCFYVLTMILGNRRVGGHGRG